uniref:Uncharacterized protein n=1 Tax=Papilio xuthus TaxID=66420 RepID=I4DLN0_PAPXU|nr:unknown unsecreted protein [Papilio xuthus]
MKIQETKIDKQILYPFHLPPFQNLIIIRIITRRLSIKRTTATITHTTTRTLAFQNTTT